MKDSVTMIFCNKEVVMFKMSNETYDLLVWVTQLLLPALGTLYFALSSIWGFPYGEQIVGTITAVDAFLGTILKISKDDYDKNNVQSKGGDIQ